METLKGSLYMHCFECNKPADHLHHVVPKIRGGSKMVPLCQECHGKVHGLDFMNHRRLTKEGLARAKARGVRLGNPSTLALAAQRSVTVRQQAAVTFAQSMLPMIQDYQQQGYSLREIAADLNRRAVPTYRGGEWSASFLCRMMKRASHPRVDIIHPR